MSVGELTTDLLVRAIRTYLLHAYSSREVPENRRYFVDIAADTDLADLLGSKGVERIAGPTPNDPVGYALRIGNAWYPHMKLTARPYNGPPGFAFGVDTHDGFRLASDSPEAVEVAQLRRRNEELARTVERAWEEEGLPTQNGLLRRYLDQSREDSGGQPPRSADETA